MASNTGDTFATVSQTGQLPKITSIFDFSADALGGLRLWLEQNPPAIGISNILGFSQFTAQGAPYIDTSESTTSNSYTDLATVGPTLATIPDGSYLLIYGSTISNESGTNASVAPSINGAAPSGGNAIVTNSLANIPGATARLVKLSNGGSNTVKLQYQSSSSNVSHFGQRWLIALRYANL